MYKTKSQIPTSMSTHTQKITNLRKIHQGGSPTCIALEPRTMKGQHNESLTSQGEMVQPRLLSLPSWPPLSWLPVEPRGPSIPWARYGAAGGCSNGHADVDVAARTWRSLNWLHGPVVKIWERKKDHDIKLMTTIDAFVTLITFSYLHTQES